MQTVHEIPLNFKPMPMSEPARVRRQVAGQLIPQLAELLYRGDKGSPHAKLTDLSEHARAVYLTAADLVLQQRAGRVMRVNRVMAHHFALEQAEGQDVIRQAHEDIACYDPGPVHQRPGFCWVCKERMRPLDAYVLHLSDSLKADVHGECASGDPRFELVSAFSFRVKGGAL